MNKSKEKQTLRLSKKTQQMVELAKAYIERKYFAYIQAERSKRKNWEAFMDKLNKMGCCDEQKQMIRSQMMAQESQALRKRRSKVRIESYQPIRKIGKGAFGEVFVCRQKESGQLVAVKRLLKDEMIKKNQECHVIAERNILATSKSAWITPLKCSFQDGECLYLVMQFLQGGDLMNQLIKKEIFSEDEARFYLVEMVLAIEEVHRLGYIHRDIKPDNILIDGDGHIKLSDFGLCKYLCEFKSQPAKAKSPSKSQLKPKNGRARLFSTVGTPDYIAPQVFSNKGYTKVADWWSVGVILFQMVVGYPPFNDKSPSATCKKILNWKQQFFVPKEAMLSEEVTDLIYSFISEAESRLGKGGAQQIKKHSFFKDVNWSKINLKPPFVPDKSDQNFSCFQTFEGIPEFRTRSKRHYSLDKYFIGYTYKPLENPPILNLLDKSPNSRSKFKQRVEVPERTPNFGRKQPQRAKPGSRLGLFECSSVSSLKSSSKLGDCLQKNTMNKKIIDLKFQKVQKH